LHILGIRDISSGLWKEVAKQQADYSKVIELDPNFAKAYYDLGFAYYLKGDNDMAIADFTKVIELDPIFAMLITNVVYAMP
jgi:tetratricopeptide (TPR) repeat protein